MCGWHVLQGAVTDLDNQVDRESCQILPMHSS